MKVSSAVLFALIAGEGSGQAVTTRILPVGGVVDGCDASSDGTVQFAVVDLDGHAEEGTLALKKRDDCKTNGQLIVKLKDGVLKDLLGRTGYISSSFQLQFDDPPQAGSLITAGFSICNNGSLALGPTTVFYQCPSGPFNNIYDRKAAPQCGPIHIQAVSCDDAEGDKAQDNAVSTFGVDNTPTTFVTVREGASDVKTQVPVAICQIGDGQVQAHTTPCTDLIPVATSEPAGVQTVTETITEVIDVCGTQEPTQEPTQQPTPMAPFVTAGARRKMALIAPPFLAAAGTGVAYGICVIL